MTGDIEHKGTVIAKEGDRIDVSIIAEGACISCQVKGICGMGDSKEKIISVISERPAFFEPGDQVNVIITKGMGMKAVVLAYIIPFFILLGSLLLILELGAGEVVAGLSSLGLTALYYICLYFNRNKIEKELIFKIRKI